jgi:very-short-patch-repair endonuclease
MHIDPDAVIKVLEPSVRAYMCDEEARCRNALASVVDAMSMCESPIEAVFLGAWRIHHIRRPQTGPRIKGLLAVSPDASDLESMSLPVDQDQLDVIVIQYPCGDYRADFAMKRTVRRGDLLLRGPNVLVECDGHDFHEKTKEQAARDKERDRYLQECGFYVLRFTGSELYRDPPGCAEQVDRFMESHILRRGTAVHSSAD